MTTYVYDPNTDRMVNKKTGEPMVTGHWEPVVPHVQGDYEPFRSPVTGEWIDGKKARREDMKRHNCIDGRDMPTMGGKFKNPRFAKKHNLPMSED